MSYTKLNKDIERFYKANNMPFHYNALTTTKEEQAERLKEYSRIRDIIVKKWIQEKKYKDLISCAHGRWFPYEEFTKPLAEYFIKENLISHLKYLCEKEIKFKIEDTLKCLKRLKEDCPELNIEGMPSIDIENYLAEKSKYHAAQELLKWRTNSLKSLDKYIELLKMTNESEYLKMIENMYKKVSMLTIKNADLKQIKHTIESC